jgi:hypothetical protein
MLGFDLPSALLCLARFCTPDVVGGVVILLSMSHLVYYHHNLPAMPRSSAHGRETSEQENGQKRAKKFRANVRACSVVSSSS